jgi:hypothetical protein
MNRKSKHTMKCPLVVTCLTTNAPLDIMDKNWKPAPPLPPLTQEFGHWLLTRGGWKSIFDVAFRSWHTNTIDKVETRRQLDRLLLWVYVVVCYCSWSATALIVSLDPLVK